MDIIWCIDPQKVSKYDYGMVRAKIPLVKKWIENRLSYAVKWGRNDHLHGIGNNNAIEIVLCGAEEEQICGLLHLTNDMFGGVIAWCSDIDNQNRTESVMINEWGVKERR